jgi:phage shock protein C
MRTNTTDEGHLYRARDGLALGVCLGLARYWGINAFWVRIAVVVLCLSTGLWPVLIGYVAAAVLMKPAPVLPLVDRGEEEFYSSYVHDRRLALSRLRSLVEGLERRIQRMESIVTSRTYSWEQRLHRD